MQMDRSVSGDPIIIHSHMMNNGRTHSAVQVSVPNPAWGDVDAGRLGDAGGQCGSRRRAARRRVMATAVRPDRMHVSPRGIRHRGRAAGCGGTVAEDGRGQREARNESDQRGEVQSLDRRQTLNPRQADAIDVAVEACERQAAAHRSAASRTPTVQSSNGPALLDRIAVIGHPSRVGGADTELDHQIRCWHAMGVEVHLCPTGRLDGHLRSLDMAGRGCVYHEPRDFASLAGMHCISFCNGEFLRHLKQIRKFVRTTTFVNCMTWNFPLEIECQRRGLIDFHLYQTDHGMRKVGEALANGSATYRPLRFTPYFHAAEFPYIDDRPRETFRFGRISRPDADKFNARQMWIYEMMTAPALKECLILGWDGRARAKVGPPPA